jgi:hypothetical protein
VQFLRLALQGMLYSTKRLCIEKATTNSSVNKEKGKAFVSELNKHIKKGNMMVAGDEPTCLSAVQTEVNKFSYKATSYD